MVPRRKPNPPHVSPGRGEAAFTYSATKGKGRGSQQQCHRKGGCWTIERFYTPLLSERLLRTSSSLFGSVGSWGLSMPRAGWMGLGPIREASEVGKEERREEGMEEGREKPGGRPAA